jgi:NAD(P)-dependent dehydrogenase (short-subunit alcohol dehydrogenase family)
MEQNDVLSPACTPAGIMACPQGKTEDGFEMQFGCNHLAHYLLFQLLKPTLIASSTSKFQSRVINVSSLGHRSSTVHLDDLNFEAREYNKWASYGQSKTANIWMANEIERRYASLGVHGLSLHPGAIQTNLQRHLDEKTKKSFESIEIAKICKSPEQGAATTVWAAVSPQWEGKGGRYERLPPLSLRD